MTSPDNDNDSAPARVPTWLPCRRAFVWRPFRPWPEHNNVAPESARALSAQLLAFASDVGAVKFSASSLVPAYRRTWRPRGSPIVSSNRRATGRA